LRGSTRGTQRVSAGRNGISVLAKLVFAAALVLLIDGGALTPASSLGSTASPVTTAGGSSVSESTTTTTATYQESSSAITYGGTWSYASYSGYLGGRVKYARAKGASATFRFSGVGVSWIGPAGPTRGQARVYVDGVYVKTVNMYATSFVARRTIFSASYSVQKARTLKIVVVGTSGHPMVAIDALTVRSLSSTTSSSSTSPKVVRFSPSGTPSQFLALVRDMTIDVIELNGGTYRNWHVYIDVARTRPLLVRPAPGAAVVWDAAGTGPGDGLFYLGYHGFTSYIAFDPAGTGGSFTIQNYALAQQGLIDTFYVDHVTFNGFQTKGITGMTGGSLSWTFYVSSDGVHRGRTITANDWNVAASSGRTVGGLQTYHNPQAQGIRALRWRITGASSAMTFYGDATGIDIEGWQISNSEYAVYSDGVAGGVLKDNTSTGSTVAPVIRYPLVDGGGNSWH
jgi:hypothetical protein